MSRSIAVVTSNPSEPSVALIASASFFGLIRSCRLLIGGITDDQRHAPLLRGAGPDQDPEHNHADDCQAYGTAQVSARSTSPHVLYRPVLGTTLIMKI